MKTIFPERFRAFAVSCLFAAGVATTIATGGSDSSLAPPPPPPPTLIALTADNAHDVASALVIGVGLSGDIGDLAGGEVEGQAVAVAPPLLKVMRADDLVFKPLINNSGKLEDCLNGGTVDVVAVLADPNTLTVGDRITAVFADCDDGEGYVISGTVDLTVSALDGDFNTEVFLIGLDVLMTDVELVEDDETLAVEGDFTLTLDSQAFPVIAQVIGGAELALTSGPETANFTDFEHLFRLDLGMSPEALFVTVVGRFDSVLLGGAVDYESTVPIEAGGDEDPYTGEILMTGAAGSTVRLVINDSTSVTLEVDENGDGVVEAFVDTTFAALNGRNSAINSSTALIVAREATHVVNGFGSLGVTPGGQFVAEAPFGLIRQQAVSGDFGPLDVSCLLGGNAAVSGSIATGGTYTAGDLLSATFDACARGGEVLNGGLDVTIGSYDQSPGDAYVVTGEFVETAFERNFGGFTFTGAGTLDVTYDHRFTSQGVMLANAGSSSFVISLGGVDHSLTQASVTAEIFLGPPPLSASRFSSGTFAAPGLGGEFVYQSISADMLLLDSDPATGPYSGELLVTADDGSRLRIVAIDTLNVRLEVDEDGNGFTDVEINTTWAALQ